MAVSVRKACPALGYCLIRVPLQSMCNEGISPSVMARVAKGTGCASADPAIKNELQSFGTTTDVQVLLGSHLQMKMRPLTGWSDTWVEREFDLEDGKLITVSGLIVLAGERMGCRRNLQGLVGDPLLFELLLEVFVSIQAELGVLEENGTEL